MTSSCRYKEKEYKGEKSTAHVLEKGIMPVAVKDGSGGVGPGVRKKCGGDMHRQPLSCRILTTWCVAALARAALADGVSQEAGLTEPPAAVTNAASWHVEIRAGAGTWSGAATYSIGGQAWTPEEGFVEFPDRISELTFPLDVSYGMVGGRLESGRLEFRGTMIVGLSDPSGPVKDSDWDTLGEGTLDIYSESDAELSAFVLDGSGRYWLRQIPAGTRTGWGLGFGPGMYVAGMDWKVSNLDQWYPSRPGRGHDYESGRVAEYQVAIAMPYVEVGVMGRMGRWSGRLDAGIGPVGVEDEDDHLLRQKLSKGSMAGLGVKGAAEVRCDLTGSVFIAASLAFVSIEASGTQEQEGYGGDLAGYYGEIDEDFSLSSVTAGLDAGWRF